MMEVNLLGVKRSLEELPLSDDYYHLQHWLKELLPQVEELMKVCNSRSDK